MEQLAELKLKKEELKKLEIDFDVIDKEYLDKLARIPNMSSGDMPDGIGDPDHVELAVWIPESGYLPSEKLGKGLNSAQYMPKKAGKHHVDLGKDLDIIDIEQSAITSGSRFSYLKGDAAILQYALFGIIKTKLIKEGFEPMIVPVLVKEQVLFGTSHFEGRDQVYEIKTEFVEDNNQLF